METVKIPIFRMLVSEPHLKRMHNESSDVTQPVRLVRPENIIIIIY